MKVNIMMRKTGQMKKLTAYTYSWRVYLGPEVLKYLGKQVTIKKTEYGFELRRADIDSIKSSNIALNGDVIIPINLINEHEDQGTYDLEIDYEEECVYLTKEN